MEKTENVLVYGSLKQGKGNFPLMRSANAEFVRRDGIAGPFVMVDCGGFPAVHYAAPEGKEREQHDINLVAGELYKIPTENLPMLDALEGHPRWYRRELLPLLSNPSESAWIYLQPFYKEAVKAALPDNIWRPTDEEKQWWATQLASGE